MYYIIDNQTRQDLVTFQKTTIFRVFFDVLYGNHGLLKKAWNNAWLPIPDKYNSSHVPIRHLHSLLVETNGEFGQFVDNDKIFENPPTFSSRGMQVSRNSNKVISTSFRYAIHIWTPGAQVSKREYERGKNSKRDLNDESSILHFVSFQIYAMKCRIFLIRVWS